MSFSLVIPSRDPSNLVPCIRAIRQQEPWLPQSKIIVVDDGARCHAESKLTRGSRITWIRGEKPFVFSCNVNIGIRAAGGDDVILMNDDALLQTANGLSQLARVGGMLPEFGLIASSCNRVGNPNQQPQSSGRAENGRYLVRLEPRMVCFICVWIPRRTIERAGYLDERFVGYGFDDDDYCRRVRQAGMKIGIWDGCFVDHSSLPSTFRRGPREANRERFEANLARYLEKWGSP